MTMSSTLVVVALGCLMFIVITEVVVAIVPLLLVLALVPRDERRELAEVLAALDSRRRLRLWPTLRYAVNARRKHLSRTRLGGRP